MSAKGVAILGSTGSIGRSALAVVDTQGASVDAFTYVAQAGYVDPTLTPLDWYVALVVAGAEQNGLPEDYVEALRAVESIPDPDPRRATEARALLKESLQGHA